ncbi:uncharacterized protein isoform X1 [Musca autumnalis]|uniref:uncharacterized protein isoform X1 n=1 Tax=Musca autumnalis TaxID=221902 RepID=UPI003CF36E23
MNGYCNFCSNKNVQTILKTQIISLPNGEKLNLKEMVNIFSLGIVNLLPDAIWSMCHKCLGQLKNCYAFVQQIKETAVILRKSEEQTKEQVSSDATNYDRLLKHQRPQNPAFRPILPKTCKPEEPKAEDCIRIPERNTSRVYRCLQCGETFKAYKHLRAHETDNYVHSQTNHQNQQHAEHSFACYLCKEKQFMSKGYLTRHIHDIHGHTYLHFFCGECEELTVMKTKENVETHFNEYHSLKCGKGKSEIDNNAEDALNEDDMDLEMHEEFLDEFLLAHTNENSFQFSECWEALDLHLPDMLHGNSTNFQNNEKQSEEFVCPKCFERYHKMPTLLKHLVEIHKLPLLVCRSCQKSFNSTRDFQKHRKTKCQLSVSTTAIPCPYCSKEFSTTLNLKQHIRTIHSQNKKHTCQLCDKQFATLDHLKKHVLSLHQNERKHVCNICSKRFTQLCHLKQHLAIHTTGKQFECTECPDKFWRNVDMKRHRKKQHNVVSSISNENAS